MEQISSYSTSAMKCQIWWHQFSAVFKDDKNMTMQLHESFSYKMGNELWTVIVQSVYANKLSMPYN